MPEWIAAAQPALLGAVLLVSARVKLLSRRGRLQATDTALTTLFGEKRAPIAYRGVGVIEILLAAALLAPPARWPEATATACLGLGFIGFLSYSRIAAPQASCGCMSAHNVPINWRAFTRAGVIVVAGGIAIGAGDTWYAGLIARPLPTIGLLAAEALLFVALSSEFDRAWLYPLRRLRVRFTNPLGGDTAVVPLDHSVNQLQHSPVYRTVAGMLRTDVRESWEEIDWRMVVYGAHYDDRAVTAVFAVPLHRYTPDDVRVAFVDDDTGEVLLRLGTPETAGTG